MISEDKLFSYVRTMANHGISDVKRWFELHPTYRYNFIVDSDADNDKLSLKERMEYYSEVKMIGVVSNPWARMAYFYETTKKSKLINQLPTSIIDQLNLDSFEECVLTIPWDSHPTENFWYMYSTNQIEWLTYIDEEGNLKEIEYLLRSESLKQDFNKIQTVLNDFTEFQIIEPYPINYQTMYSTEMKNIVETVFHKDIEYFGYKF